VTARDDVLAAVRGALRSEPRLDLHRFPIAVSLDEDALILEGDVANIAQKKLALERAAAVPGSAGILDRLRVRPAERMGDEQVRNAVRDALLGEPAFGEIALYEIDAGDKKAVRTPDGARGSIVVEVSDGVVTLDGQVLGLGHKRLAGVLAWWVPGSRDVINGLAVEPPEEDNDAEIADAVRIALEKDMFVNASQIRIGVKNAVVTLAGLVPNEAEREMAEFDAWYVFAVDKVVNRIEVHP